MGAAVLSWRVIENRLRRWVTTGHTALGTLATVCAALLFGCTRTLEGAPCPCTDGWICCDATQSCVASNAQCPEKVDSTLDGGVSGSSNGGSAQNGGAASLGAGGSTQNGATSASVAGGAARDGGVAGSAAQKSTGLRAMSGSSGTSEATPAGAIASGGVAGAMQVGGLASGGTAGATQNEGGMVGSGQAGATSSCFVAANVTATTDLPFVRVAWDAPIGAVPTGYLIERDDQEAAQLGAGITSFDDHVASAPLPTPTALEATRGTLPGIVRLTWQTPAVAAQTHRYAVVAVYGSDATQRCRSTSVAVGNAIPPTVIGYEFSRDGGVNWQTAGTEPTYDDNAAAQGLLVATSTAQFDPTRGLVVVSMDSDPVALSAAPSSYRVRALTSAGAGPRSESAQGFAGIGSIVDYQWQRSSGVDDADYTDLPDVTGAVWIDAQAPLDATRHYRAVMTTQGANGISQPSRVTTNTVRSLSAGGNHSCAILSNSRAVCWGSNAQGQSNVPSDRFDSISAGGTHTCAINANDKSLNCWGDNSSGQAPISYFDSFLSVSAGTAHTCALHTDQQVSCWGRNSDGQANVPSGAFSSVSSGERHTCGILTNGDVVCWGDDTYGQAPALLAGPFRMIAAGAYHNCAILSAGDILCWGQNSSGEAPPGFVTGPFKSVSAGLSFTCGVLESGKVRCWGQNPIGQAPSDPPTDAFLTPAPKDAFDTVTSGTYHSCGVRRDGRVLCWGDNSYGQAPPLPPVGKFNAVSVAAMHACAIEVDGHVSCWGSPRGSTSSMPTTDTFQAVTAGTHDTCGVKTDGQAVCWNSVNLSGEASPSPEDQFKSLALEYNHTCGVRTDDTITCWGSDWIDGFFAGQVSMVPPTHFRAVSAGYGYGCGIQLADGTIRCWGINSLGQAPDVVPNGPYISLASRLHYSCGVNAQGAIHCWGQQDAESTTPSGVFSSVTVGMAHACALRTSDQKVVCWGDNILGQAPDSPSIDAFQSISAGEFSTCGVRVDGKILCWGRNAFREAPRPEP